MTNSHVNAPIMKKGVHSCKELQVHAQKKRRNKLNNTRN